MARKRPGDDAAGDRPDDEVYEVAEEDDDEAAESDPVRGGGTALRERRPREKKDVRRAGPVGVIGRFIREIIGELRKVIRTGFFGRIGGFFREVVSELRKVIWPTRKELLTYTGVVIAFVTVVTAIVALLDFGFAKAILFAFGN